MSTGFKLFVILSIALLPLGLIALLASIQSNRTADLERQAIVRISLIESARKLSAELAADLSAIERATAALQANPVDPDVCPRLTSVLRAQSAQPPQFAIFTSLGDMPCASVGFKPARPLVRSADPQVTASIRAEADSLRLVAKGGDGGSAAVLRYPKARLLQQVKLPAYIPPHRLVLTSGRDDGMPMELANSLRRDLLTRTDTLVHQIGIADLELAITFTRVDLSSADLLALLTPLLMWLAAATIGWLVVDRMLIGPLRRLEKQVAAYQPGTTLGVAPIAGPSRELRQLGESFHTLGETVSAHEARLEEGLARQTRLTREVHHRVKNNLQVIASLINLHARAAKSDDATAAYVSIQRRVDALSVVHRNHYAELEENQGLSLRSLVTEIASNFRASSADGGAKPSLTLDIVAVQVMQDVAVAVAFLVTELLELALQLEPGARIEIVVVPATAPGRAALCITSPALVGSAAFDALYVQGFSRVIEGLSRQLRAPIDRDLAAGSFKIEIPVIAAAPAA